VQPGGELLPTQCMSDYATVMAANPTAISDIVLRANLYSDFSTTGASIVSAMQTLLSNAVQFKAFSFDNMEQMSPTAQQAVVKFAHDNGMLVGGSWTVAGGKPSADFDYYILADAYDFANDIDTVPYTTSFIEGLGKPVILSFDDGPEPVTAAGVTYHAWFADTIANEGSQYSTYGERTKIISVCVGQQRLGYSYAYPVYFPVGQVGPPSIMYDASADGGMLDVIFSSMVQNNPRR
jgi:hypothetical protein